MMNAPMKHTTLRNLTLLIAVTFFMEMLDSTIAVTAIPKMALSFGVHATEVTMAMAIYLLSIAVFLPLGGWLTKNLGAKSVFLLAVGLFAGGSLLCGLSTNIKFFMGAEFLQGAGSALMVPVGRLFVMQYCEKSQFVKMMSLLVWPGLVAPVLGPPVGAWITTHFSWHWLFFVNVPVALVVIVLTALFFPKTQKAQLEPSPFDGLGFFYSACTFIFGLGFLDWISIVGINHPMPWALLVLSLGMGWRLFTHSAKTQTPIVSFVSCKSTFSYRIALISGSLFRCSVGGFPLLVPLFLQSQLGLSLIDSGNIVLLMFLGNLTMKPFTTTIMMRLGFKWPLIVATAISALSILSCWLGKDHLWIIGVALFINGLMRSLQFSGFNTLTFSDVPKPQLNGANVLSNLVNQSSFAIGIALVSVFMRMGETSSAAHTISGQSMMMAFIGLSVLALLPILNLLRLRASDGNSVRV